MHSSSSTLQLYRDEALNAIATFACDAATRCRPRCPTRMQTCSWRVAGVRQGRGRGEVGGGGGAQGMRKTQLWPKDFRIDSAARVSFNWFLCFVFRRLALCFSHSQRGAGRSRVAAEQRDRWRSPSQSRGTWLACKLRAMRVRNQLKLNCNLNETKEWVCARVCVRVCVCVWAGCPCHLRQLNHKGITRIPPAICDSWGISPPHPAMFTELTRLFVCI